MEGTLRFFSHGAHHFLSASFGVVRVVYSYLSHGSLPSVCR